MCLEKSYINQPLIGFLPSQKAILKAFCKSQVAISNLDYALLYVKIKKILQLGTKSYCIDCISGGELYEL